MLEIETPVVVPAH